MDEQAATYGSQILQAYGAGLLTLLTPCIYPLIPVTLSIAGVTGCCSRWAATKLVATYVLGISVMYTFLGVIAAQSGLLFGSLLGNPWAVGVIALFYLSIALFSLDIFHLPAIGSLQNKASRLGGSGYVGSFLMGTMSGVVAAPCAGPILALVLPIAAASGDPWKGGVLLFVYSLGFGTPFLILGMFSNLLAHLPRAGTWLNVIKFLISTALLYVALMLIKPFLPDSITMAIAARTVSLALSLAAVGFLAGISGYRLHRGALRVFGAACLALAVGQLTFRPPAALSEEDAARAGWLSSIEQGLAQASRNDRVVLVDMFAEWCAACKELDEKTFPAPKVKEALTQFVKVRLDLTLLDDDQERLLKKFRVPGLPAILFLKPNGEEIPDTRITGFLPPQEFVRALSKVTTAPAAEVVKITDR